MTGNINKPKNKFGMLLKHDFLASARVISLFYIVEAISFLLFKVGEHLAKNTVDPGKLVSKIIGFAPFALIISVVVAFLLVFLTIFYIIYDFNKSLYSPQGYLSFTLPVSSEQLLASKTFIYGGWMVVSYFVFYLILEQTMAFTNEYLVDELGESGVEAGEMLLTQMFNLPSLSQIIASAVFMMLNVFTLMFLFVATAYFTITVSHMRYFQKSNILWAIVLFFPVFSILTKLAFMPSEHFQMIVQFKADGSFGFGVAKAGEAYVGGYDISRMLMCIIECVGLFFGTSYLMHKKVNIK